MKKIVSSVGLIAGGLVAVAAPLVAFAQNNAGTAGQGNGLVTAASSLLGQGNGLVTAANSLLNITIGALITLEIVIFIFFIIKLILTKDVAGQTANKKYLFWSILAIAITIGIFGIAKLILSSVGINGNNLQSSDIPTVPAVSGGGTNNLNSNPHVGNNGPLP